MKIDWALFFIGQSRGVFHSKKVLMKTVSFKSLLYFLKLKIQYFLADLSKSSTLGITGKSNIPSEESKNSGKKRKIIMTECGRMTWVDEE